MTVNASTLLQRTRFSWTFQNSLPTPSLSTLFRPPLISIYPSAITLSVNCAPFNYISFRPPPSRISLAFLSLRISSFSVSLSLFSSGRAYRNRRSPIQSLRPCSAKGVSLSAGRYPPPSPYSYVSSQPHRCAQRLFIKKLLAILDCPRGSFARGEDAREFRRIPKPSDAHRLPFAGKCTRLARLMNFNCSRNADACLASFRSIERKSLEAAASFPAGVSSLRTCHHLLLSIGELNSFPVERKENESIVVSPRLSLVNLRCDVRS